MYFNMGYAFKEEKCWNINAHALEGTTKHEKAQSSKLKVKNQPLLNLTYRSLLIAQYFFMQRNAGMFTP